MDEWRGKDDPVTVLGGREDIGRRERCLGQRGGARSWSFLGVSAKTDARDHRERGV